MRRSRKTRWSPPAIVVSNKQIKSKKSGEPYLDLTLMDRTGTIQAKMWDNVEECTDHFEQDDIVKIKGLINKYNQRWQLTVHKVRKMDAAEIDFSDYLPKTSKDIDELWQTLGDVCRLHRGAPPAPAAGAVHGRSGDRPRLSQRARRQDDAPRMHRRTARPRGFAVPLLRPGVPQLRVHQPRPAAHRRLPA